METEAYDEMACKVLGYLKADPSGGSDVDHLRKMEDTSDTKICE